MSSYPSRLSMSAHPHSRGENSHNHMQMNGSLGSSPLTRGKLRRARGRVRSVGLIPTHAGKTLSRICSGRSGWAHPHSRGENFQSRDLRRLAKGSSPLTRGKQMKGIIKNLGTRLIPTHAGKTHILATRYPPKRGSSPLTRGKLCWLSIVLVCVGLIPTHAGKTLSPGSASVRTPAHPHSRGENRVRASRLSRSRGSSPLTRGKHSISLRTCR